MKIKRDYRIPEQLFKKTKESERTWLVTHPAWDAYADCSKSQLRAFLNRLTPGQRAFVALNGLEAELNNGGIHQYFWNSTGNLFEDAMAGLALVGASDHLKLLSGASALFKSSEVLKNRRRRQKALDKISTEETFKRFDEPFYKLEKRKRRSLEALQRAYLEKHTEQFVRPADLPAEPLPALPSGKKDYRVLRKKAAALRGEALHWAVIEKLWDDYWEILKAGAEATLEFLPRLSRGQRALIVVDIVNKTVLQANTGLGGLQHFLSSQAAADVMVKELQAAYALLGAKAYPRLLNKALRLAGDLPQLQRLMEDRSRDLITAKESGDEKVVAAAREAFMTVHKNQLKREGELGEKLDSLTQEFTNLLESAGQKIEPYVEAYIDAHPEEFFR